MTKASVDAIVRELKIEAPPPVVYAHFVDPEKLVRWMGRTALIDAQPGGDFHLDYNGFDRMRGRFVELIPDRRIVFTWGWSTLGTQTPPSSSRVEVTLTPDGDGTLLRLIHSGFGSDEEVDGHVQGWDLFLPFLAETVLSGQAAQPPAAAPSAPELAAARLNALLCELRYLVEGASTESWERTCTGSGWPVGVTALHAASHTALVEMAAMVAARQPPPVASFTQDALKAMNEESARVNSAVTRSEVLEAVLGGGPGAVALLKGLDPASLANAQPMAFAGGAAVSASDLIEGPLLDDLAAHLADISAALRAG